MNALFSQVAGPIAQVAVNVIIMMIILAVRKVFTILLTAGQTVIVAMAVAGIMLT